jgi:chorismate mutase/prephenate dehydratase
MNGGESAVDQAARRAAVAEHRRGIDRIDRTIVALLGERMRLGRTLGEIKRELDLPARSDVREAEVLERVRQAAAGPLSPRSAERIFSAIIAETVAAQQRLDE